MNRSMDTRHPEPSATSALSPSLPPLLSQLPPLPMPPSLLAQSNIVAHGPRKDCIRLRGLPYEAKVYIYI